MNGQDSVRLNSESPSSLLHEMVTHHLSIVPSVLVAKTTYIYIYPMDPSTFLGSVWGIIYYNLEA